MQNSSYELTFTQVLLLVIERKWAILISVIIGCLVSVVVAINTPNIYRASILSIPTEESKSGGLAAIAGQLGGLANMAGINLGSGSQEKLTIAMETLKSRAFLTKVIDENNWKHLIIGPNGWDYQKNALTYDTSIYDPVSQKWVRDVSFPQQVEPTLQEVHRYFIDHNLRVIKNLETGTVELSVKHYSPQVARQMVELIFVEINEFIRQKEISEAERSIEYLTKKSDDVSLSDMKAVFYELIEQQLQTVMLANVREEFFFQTIEPAVTPEMKSSPNRPLIVVLGCALGVFFGLMYCLLSAVLASFRKS